MKEIKQRFDLSDEEISTIFSINNYVNYFYHHDEYGDDLKILFENKESSLGYKPVVLELKENFITQKVINYFFSMDIIFIPLFGKDIISRTKFLIGFTLGTKTLSDTSPYKIKIDIYSFLKSDVETEFFMDMADYVVIGSINKHLLDAFYEDKNNKLPVISFVDEKNNNNLFLNKEVMNVNILMYYKEKGIDFKPITEYHGNKEKIIALETSIQGDSL